MPRFIAIEGGEGSGKSSLVSALKDSLGDSVVVTREPGGSPYGEAIRDLALKDPRAGQAPAATMLCLMFASRYDHVENIIRPALSKGLSVVSDRFDGSSYAYNVCAQSRGSLEDLFWKLRTEISVLPDLYVYIDVDPMEGLRRVARRNEALVDGNHFDMQTIEFHKKVREGYLEFLSKVPHVTVDANRSFAEVSKDFIDLIKEKATRN